MRRWAGGWAAVAAIIGPFVIAQVWGPDIWSGIAPGWPGGGYGFAVSAGVLLPWGAAAVILPLARITWGEPRRHWLVQVALALPGAAVSLPVLVVIAGAWRPKPRKRGLDCHDVGAPCWVHEQYPYVWAAGLGATLVGAALLVPLLVVRANRRKDRTQSPT
ncbi:hypothetical protein [Streptomyces sp. NBC_00005]|uniref:hypothetical protein n=1 Tax=Streptomyces sp. NBC_00005 TaxID=2903609 RepID=UPI003252E6EA